MGVPAGLVEKAPTAEDAGSMTPGCGKKGRGRRRPELRRAMCQRSPHAIGVRSRSFARSAHAAVAREATVGRNSYEGQTALAVEATVAHGAAAVAERNGAKALGPRVAQLAAFVIDRAAPVCRQRARKAAGQHDRRTRMSVSKEHTRPHCVP